MIEARRYSSSQVRQAYSRRSWVYSKVVAPVEFSYHLQAIAKAAIQPQDKVLEVAVGPGLALLEMVKRLDKANTIYGVDIAPGMLAIAKRTLEQAGYTNMALSESNAAALKFPDETFDVLYNGYMLDLIPLAQMQPILNEFKRVLKPGGRLVLLNMSKPRATATTLREKLYKVLPANIVLYIGGGCRPVLMEESVRLAGFKAVEREFLDGKFPSEIVTALK